MRSRQSSKAIILTLIVSLLRGGDKGSKGVGTFSKADRVSHYYCLNLIPKLSNRN
jgi:hypothetical protein